VCVLNSDRKKGLVFSRIGGCGAPGSSVQGRPFAALQLQARIELFISCFALVSILLVNDNSYPDGEKNNCC